MISPMMNGTMNYEQVSLKLLATVNLPKVIARISMIVKIIR
jgi:hypothetical protein